MSVHFARPMDESEFIRLASQARRELDRRIEVSGIDADCEFMGADVLEIEFGDRSRIIVNSRAAAREIWVASKSGGYHFRRDGPRRVNTRDGGELFAALRPMSASSQERR